MRVARGSGSGHSAESARAHRVQTRLVRAHFVLCRGLVVFALLAVLGAARADPPAPPHRIASLNLCTDQLLLMLLDRDRIASVTAWSQKPESSYMAEAARGLPTNDGLAEQVLPLRPDLIITGRYNQGAMTNLLGQLGYAVAVVEVPLTLQAARLAIIEFGQLVGAEAAAQRLVVAMDARLAAIDRAVAPRSQRPLAAVYAPNGVTAGAGTVMNDIVERAGMRNLAAELGLVGYGQLPLEQLVAAKPDVLILDATAEPEDGGSLAHRYLDHPALADIMAKARVVSLPPPLSVCVGPMTVDAIERLAGLT